MKISILLPARKRPKNVIRMFNSIKDTMSHENPIEIILRCDDDDETMIGKDFMTSIFNAYGEHFETIFVVGEPTFPDLGVLWNDCYEEATGDILQLGGDDLIYKSKDWDKKVVQTFENSPDKIILVWGFDGIHNNVLATHPFISRKWVETVGWFAPPYGLTYANDNFIHDIGAAIGRLHFINDMHIIHKRMFSDNHKDPNYPRMEQHFKRSSDFFYGPEGKKIIKEKADKLRKVMI